MSGRRGKRLSLPVPVASLPTGTAPYGYDKLGRRKPRPYRRDEAQNPRWKGGRRWFQGYWMQHAPGHPAACRNYVLEHRLIVERHIGRYLKPNEFVHHLNYDKSDNRIENLQVVSPSTHAVLHRDSHSAPPAALLDEQVLQVRKMWKQWSRRQQNVNALARRYHVGRTTILDALHGVGAYRHLNRYKRETAPHVSYCKRYRGKKIDVASRGL